MGQSTPLPKLCLIPQKCSNIPSGKGKRVVVLHTNSADVGFIPECEIIFVGMHDDQMDLSH